MQARIYSLITVAKQYILKQKYTSNSLGLLPNMIISRMNLILFVARKALNLSHCPYPGYTTVLRRASWLWSRKLQTETVVKCCHALQRGIEHRAGE